MTLDLAMIFFSMMTKVEAKTNKKIRQIGFMKIKNLYIEIYYLQPKKATNKLQENICK